MMLVSTVFACALGFVVSWRLSNRFAHPDSRFYLSDVPNARSLHTVPVSRSGGLALLIGLLAGLVVVLPGVTMTPQIGYFCAGAAAIALVSWFDDRRGLSPGIRLFVHALAAGLALAGGLALSSFRIGGLEWAIVPWLGAMLAVLFTVWSVNLYNFMDGMDGFSGGMAVVGFGIFAALGAVQGAWGFVALAALIASAAGGFLVVNWPPARVFLGDTGASVLGYLFAVMALWADREQLFPLWIGVLVFSVFVVDATFTLIRRALRGEKVWQAHRSHCYQRLVGSGWSHRRTVLAGYLVMLACGVTAIALVVLSKQGAVAVQPMLLLFWAVAYTGLITLVNRVEGGSKE